LGGPLIKNQWHTANRFIKIKAFEKTRGHLIQKTPQWWKGPAPIIILGDFNRRSLDWRSLPAVASACSLICFWSALQQWRRYVCGNWYYIILQSKRYIILKQQQRTTVVSSDWRTRVGQCPSQKATAVTAVSPCVTTLIILYRGYTFTRGERYIFITRFCTHVLQTGKINWCGAAVAVWMSAFRCKSQPWRIVGPARVRHRIFPSPRLRLFNGRL